MVITLKLNLTLIFSVNLGVKALNVSGTGCIELLSITLLTVLFLVVLGGRLILGELVVVGDNLLIGLLCRGPGGHSWDNSYWLESKVSTNFPNCLS